MYKIFIDTEFSDFQNMELISIAFTGENGEYYGENKDIDMSICSEFVKINVLPLLYNETYSKKYELLSHEVYHWLSNCPPDTVIVGDYDGDWLILQKLLNDNLPPNIVGFTKIYHLLANDLATHLNVKTLNFFEKECIMLENEFKNSCTQYFKTNNKNSHHALDDARANKYGYEAAFNLIKGVKKGR